MSGNSPRIIALDTATPACAVAIIEGTRACGRILGARFLVGLTHSRRLLAAISELMTECALEWKDISGIAVGLGPGSFTGLRIGMATAKGVAAAAGIPLLGYDTLYCLAVSCTGYAPSSVCALLDARKKEVYAAVYRWQDGELIQEGRKMVLAPAEMVAYVPHGAVLVGDGAVLYREQFEKGCNSICFVPAWLNQPSAAVLGFLGAEQFLAGDSLDIASASPVYVRKSDAELNLAEKSKKV